MEKKSSWTNEEKLALVHVVLSGLMTARRASEVSGVPYTLLRTWVRQYRAGTLGSQLYVTLDLWLEEPSILEIERRLERSDDPSRSVTEWVLDLMARELEQALPGPAPEPGPLVLELSMEELPQGAETKRWNSKRRQILIQAVLSGQLSFEDACQRYELQPAELRQWLSRNNQLERGRCRIHFPRNWLPRMEVRWRREKIKTQDDSQAAAEWIRRLVGRELARGGKTPPTSAVSPTFRPFGGPGFGSRKDRS